MKTRISTLCVMMVIALSAAAMPFTDAREKALNLSDKMAYELNLTNSQLEAVYEINLDYFLNIEDESDLYGYLKEIRNRDMNEVLTASQYANYENSDWLNSPLTVSSNGWTLAVNERYADGKFMFDLPLASASYQGGHSKMDASFYANLDLDATAKYLGQAD